MFVARDLAGRCPGLGGKNIAKAGSTERPSPGCEGENLQCRRKTEGPHLVCRCLQKEAPCGEQRVRFQAAIPPIKHSGYPLSEEAMRVGGKQTKKLRGKRRGQSRVGCQRGTRDQRGQQATLGNWADQIRRPPMQKLKIASFSALANACRRRTWPRGRTTGSNGARGDRSS